MQQYMRKGFLFHLAPAGAEPMKNVPETCREWTRAHPMDNAAFLHGGVSELADGSYFFGRPDENTVGFPEGSGTEPPYGFSAVRFDRKNGIVEIVRDGLGIFPTYYAVVEGNLVIGTDMRSVEAVLRDSGIRVSPNPQAIYETFVFKTTPPDVPLLNPIRNLEFGTLRKFEARNGDILELDPVVAFPMSFSKPKNDGDFEGEYRTAFLRILSEIRDERPVGVLFTGGLDSTLILDSLRKYRAVEAFTVVQRESPKDDDAMAERYCREHGIRHHVIELDVTDYARFPKTIRTVEDSDSALPGLTISLLAAAEEAGKLGFGTLISGSYIEPILGSNPSTLLTLKYLQYGGKYPGKQIFNSFSEQFRNGGVDYRKLAEKEVFPTVKFLSALSKIQSKIFFNEADESFPMEKSSVFDPDFFSGIESERSILPNYFFKEDKKITVFDLLTYVDLVFRGNIRNNLINQRIAQETGVEILPVFAHRDLRNLIFRLPVERKFNPLKYETTQLDNKFFLYESLGPLIPESLAKRKKTDPSVPAFAVWLQSEGNQETIAGAFDGLEKRKLFAGDFLRSMRKFHSGCVRAKGGAVSSLVGEGRKIAVYQRIVWKLLAIEEWYRSREKASTAPEN